MSKYEKFIFKHYEFDKESGILTLSYRYDDSLEFRETYHFDFQYVDYDEKVLDRAIQLLFFIAGVSYYKLYVAEHIVVDAGQIDKPLSDFLSKTYQKGLGEFFYVNNLSPTTDVSFPINSPSFTALSVNNSRGKLIGLGGGKDSLVSVEIMKDQPDIATWSLNHRSQLEPLVNKVGLKHFWVERQWDEQIKQLNSVDALNGHIPISAIFASVGTVVSVLSGYKDNIVSNESSASEPTLSYQGVDINHQYSKSLEFEKDFQRILSLLFNDNLRYYSLLRPFSELRIAEIFSKDSFEKYKDVFSSCNRAYTHDQHHMFWCGECPKCAFVFLILMPFIDKDYLTQLWRGKNLLLDPALEHTYLQLLGIDSDKPFDCVGEIKEARTAMRLAQNIYPDLNRYHFDIPDSYNFRAWSEQSMPDDVFELLKTKIS